MKRVILLVFLFSLIFVGADMTPNGIDDAIGKQVGNIGESIGEVVGEVGRNTNIYAEILGENLLKFQEFFIGVAEFISLGFFDVGEDMAFVTFLFFILLFMIVYGVIEFMFDKFAFGISFTITLLAFIGMDRSVIETIFLNYGAMGITVTVILPILILLAFTFRIYQRAYEGESKTSPFYAEMFNLVFMIFFGVFFIRHSYSEEGLISVMRYLSGWVLIGLGIGQTVFYKVFARFVHIQRVEERKFKESIRKMKRDFIDAKNEIEIEAIGS